MESSPLSNFPDFFEICGCNCIIALLKGTNHIYILFICIYILNASAVVLLLSFIIWHYKYTKYKASEILVWKIKFVITTTIYRKCWISSEEYLKAKGSDTKLLEQNSSKKLPLQHEERILQADEKADISVLDIILRSPQCEENLNTPDQPVEKIKTTKCVKLLQEESYSELCADCVSKTETSNSMKEGIFVLKLASNVSLRPARRDTRSKMKHVNAPCGMIVLVGLINGKGEVKAGQILAVLVYTFSGKMNNLCAAGLKPCAVRLDNDRNKKDFHGADPTETKVRILEQAINNIFVLRFVDILRLFVLKLKMNITIFLKCEKHILHQVARKVSFLQQASNRASALEQPGSKNQTLQKWTGEERVSELHSTKESAENCEAREADVLDGHGNNQDVSEKPMSMMADLEVEIPRYPRSMPDSVFKNPRRKAHASKSSGTSALRQRKRKACGSKLNKSGTSALRQRKRKACCSKPYKSGKQALGKRKACVSKHHLKRTNALGKRKTVFSKLHKNWTTALGKRKSCLPKPHKNRTCGLGQREACVSKPHKNGGGKKESESEIGISGLSSEKAVASKEQIKAIVLQGIETSVLKDEIPEASNKFLSDNNSYSASFLSHRQATSRAQLRSHQCDISAYPSYGRKGLSNLLMRYQLFRLCSFVKLQKAEYFKPWATELAASGFYSVDGISMIRCFSCGQEYNFSPEVTSPEVAHETDCNWQDMNLSLKESFETATHEELDQYYREYSSKWSQVEHNDKANFTTSDGVEGEEQTTGIGISELSGEGGAVAALDEGSASSDPAVASCNPAPASSVVNGSSPGYPFGKRRRSLPENLDACSSLVSKEESLQSSQGLLTSASKEPVFKERFGADASAAGAQVQLPRFDLSKASYPQFASSHSRRQTYGSWSRDHPKRPEDLVQAGFFYAGYADCVRCFYCGVGLKYWRRDDIPEYQHARTRPNCVYNYMLMGQEYVERVQQDMVPKVGRSTTALPPDQRSQNEGRRSDRQGQPSTQTAAATASVNQQGHASPDTREATSTDEQPSPYLRGPLARDAINKGWTPEQVKEAILYIITNLGGCRLKAFQASCVTISPVVHLFVSRKK
ncbi:baculoviral iap repeat-containing protein 7 [Plakobranchus ocellatus]|uniref:Baculoviral iap repeat-containing protein 7 n=1 Tax=Plakobranchus ocellatus TaxID=259542 RepID=A0AAV4A9S6_9GAST|nr:baculoviral iap repeat-containing protein 7 [Plakobranchus ocellatus]